MANNKFNFYNVYINDLKKLNSFQFKKVVMALSNYAKTGNIPDKLSKKGSMVFTKIMVVIDTEKTMEKELNAKREAASKGGKNRWRSENKHILSKNKVKLSTKINKSDSKDIFTTQQ